MSSRRVRTRPALTRGARNPVVAEPCVTSGVPVASSSSPAVLTENGTMTPTSFARFANTNHSPHAPSVRAPTPNMAAKRPTNGVTRTKRMGRSGCFANVDAITSA